MRLNVSGLRSMLRRMVSRALLISVLDVVVACSLCLKPNLMMNPKRTAPAMRTKIHWNRWLSCPFLLKSIGSSSGFGYLNISGIPIYIKHNLHHG